MLVMKFNYHPAQQKNLSGFERAKHVFPSKESNRTGWLGKLQLKRCVNLWHVYDRTAKYRSSNTLGEGGWRTILSALTQLCIFISKRL